ncbi:MAG: cupin domain-containing protein [Bacteroidota bacterium]
MQSTIINEAGNWSYWSKALKEELENARNNFQVGAQLVLENKQLKVWTIHLPPNERLPFHTHNKPYLWTALSEGKARSYFDDGSVKDNTYEIGDTMYYDDLHEEHYFVHDLKNIGKSILIFSTIEFKKTKK